MMETRVIPPDHASARQTEMGETFDRILFATVDALEAAKISYALIGGIAVSGMGRPRSTHDIDVFVRPEDADASLEALEAAGFETEKTDRRWLYKGWKDEMMVDIIFKSQGDIYFDDEMKKHAKRIHYHGRDIPVVAPEDLIVIKGAVHSEIGPHHWHDSLALLSHANIDWPYLIHRARRAHRRVLALLIYAQSNDIFIPNSVINELFNTIFGAHVPVHTSPQAPASNVANANRASELAKSAMAAKTEATKTPVQDAYLLPHLQEALATDARTASLDVEVNVGERMISVKGEVQSKDQRSAIEAVINDCCDGFEVDNQVRLTKIAPPQAEEVV